MIQINRYNNGPAQIDARNTYVPIPFDDMLRVAAMNQQQIDKSLADLSAATTKWSDFVSLSDIDNQNYYNETYGKVQPVINDLAGNIEKLKTAAGRAELTMAINNIDYAKIGQLKASAVNFAQRQAYNLELAKANRFNGLWHDVDFANYDTLSSGIFQDTSPTPYMSIAELATPYVDNIKDSFIKSSGGYDYFGVTDQDRIDILDAQQTELLGSPAAQKHIEQRMKLNGGDQAEAEQWFMTRAINDTEQYSHINREANQFALINAQENARAARLKKEQKAADPLTPLLGFTSDKNGKLVPTGSLDYEGVAHTMAVNGDPTKFPISTKLAMDNNGKPFTPAFAAEFRRAHNKDLGTIWHKNSSEYGTSNSPLNAKTDDEIHVGSKAILDTYSVNSSDHAKQAVLQHVGTGTDVNAGKRLWQLRDRGTISTAAGYVARMRGEESEYNNREDMTDASINKALSEGRLTNINIQSIDDFIYWNDENGGFHRGARVTALIPTDELENNKSIKFTGNRDWHVGLWPFPRRGELPNSQINVPITGFDDPVNHLTIPMVIDLDGLSQPEVELSINNEYNKRMLSQSNADKQRAAIEAGAYY
jgi:hypothetical protein